MDEVPSFRTYKLPNNNKFHRTATAHKCSLFLKKANRLGRTRCLGQTLLELYVCSNLHHSFSRLARQIELPDLVPVWSGRFFKQPKHHSVDTWDLLWHQVGACMVASYWRTWQGQRGDRHDKLSISNFWQLFESAWKLCLAKRTTIIVETGGVNQESRTGKPWPSPVEAFYLLTVFVVFALSFGGLPWWLAHRPFRRVCVKWQGHLWRSDRRTWRKVSWLPTRLRNPSRLWERSSSPKGSWSRRQAWTFLRRPSSFAMRAKWLRRWAASCGTTFRPRSRRRSGIVSRWRRMTATSCPLGRFPSWSRTWSRSWSTRRASIERVAGAQN